MLPSTVLVSALPLPVANYSSAHLADLLAGRDEGECNEHDPSETQNIPAICHPHSCLPEQERKAGSVEQRTSERGDK